MKFSQLWKRHGFFLLGLLAVIVVVIISTSIAKAAGATYIAHLSWIAPTKNTDGSNITGAISYRVTSGATSQMSSATALDWPNTAPGQCFTVSAIVANIESVQSSPSCLGQAPNAPTTITITVTTTVTVP